MDRDEVIDQEILEVLNTYPAIYKYTSLETCKTVLEKSTIAFSNPDAFNDPFDCYNELLSFDNITNDAVKIMIDSNEEIPKDRKERVINKLTNDPYSKEELIKLFGLESGSFYDAKQGLGVSCFTTKPNNLLMWSHYGNSHRGVCLVFEPWPFITSLSEHGHYTIIKVNYTEEFIPIDFFENSNRAIRKWLGTKSSVWAYEEEIRVTLMDIIKNPHQKIAYIPFDKKSLKAIYIGKSVSEIEVQNIVNLCKNNHNGEILLFKMVTDPSAFRLGNQRIHY